MTHNLLFDRSTAHGRLELLEQDRLKLLHNMSTNDFNTLTAGWGRPTVLTTALARIIDRVIVYHRGGTALVLTNYPAVVRPWLQRHIFWGDRISVKDVSADLGQLELYGDGAGALAESLTPGASGLALHQFVETETGTLLVARTYPLAGDGFTVIASAGQIAAIRDRLLSEGNVREGTADEYERLRIEAGMAGAHHELTEDYIPLEAGLWDSVSFNKGCYIGQEIIARMESRSKLAKTLVKLHLAALPPLGVPIQVEDRGVGVITSAASREDGSAVALGFIKPDYANPGVKVTVHPEGGTLIPAEVVHAPLLQVGFADR